MNPTELYIRRNMDPYTYILSGEKFSPLDDTASLDFLFLVQFSFYTFHLYFFFNNKFRVSGIFKRSFVIKVEIIYFFVKI